MKKIEAYKEMEDKVKNLGKYLSSSTVYIYNPLFTF